MKIKFLYLFFCFMSVNTLNSFQLKGTLYEKDRNFRCREYWTGNL